MPARDDNDPSRYPSHGHQNNEDNPFIAFRRFADSQVSSLLNTVITLPATIANYNNAHVAREQCLFGRADKQKCHRLAELEAQVASLRAEGRELYQVGDLQAMIRKGEQLMHLDHQAEDIRRDIVEAARSRNGQMQQPSPDDWRQTQSRIMEKVANEKGQQWGWMWDWGFPRPFDAEDDNIWPDSTRKNGAPRNMDSPPSPQQVQAQIQGILDDIGSAIAREVPRIFASPWYSPSSLEEDKSLQRSGINWRDAFEDLIRSENGAPLIPSDSLGRQQEQSYNEWARRFHDPKTARGEVAAWVAQTEDQKPSSPSKEMTYPLSSSAAEEPSYEYGHDHEDQHDDIETDQHPHPQQSSSWFSSKPATAPTTRKSPETELDAYEQLLGRIHHHPTDSKPSDSQQRVPSGSILSTMTTTERTTAPDGTVTTRVVLKKRFVDGREESSETVHTQRGEQVTEENHSSVNGHSEGRKTGSKGWFWSS
ncbi:unnamed protein product [Periconia digitata]|uniref:Uncharacterized protein n=1 Tax=Periconia digitata TaxID=1303443 RepID=A0A9W4XFF0_9PLEO|nr:unnamed protein product [Periconia digitata]